jgi:hypothetical protein
LPVSKIFLRSIFNFNLKLVEVFAIMTSSWQLEVNMKAQNNFLDRKKNLPEVMPPSVPERTLQASGQGQAIARLNGSLPC